MPLDDYLDLLRLRVRMPDSSVIISTGSVHSTLSLSKTNLIVQNTATPSANHGVPHRNILRASVHAESRVLTVAFLDQKKKKKKEMELVVIEGEVEESQTAHAAEWVESVMKAAYDDLDIKRSRRLMVFVNPFGGTKKGAQVFLKKVEPIFKAAGCPMEVLYTTHQGHGKEVAKTLPFTFDAIVTVSGDGMVHEILNGFLEHAHPLRAFSTPIAPIPSGSGNGLAVNLLGHEMKVDLCSVTQSGKRSISFMSQALGLMAELDIGTDNLRWMGETRFVYGLFRGILKFNPCPVQLSYKVATNDKHKMAQTYHSIQSEKVASPTTPSSAGFGDFLGRSLPPLKYLPDDDDGWTTFTEPTLYVYAGKGPYVSRDFMAFPVSLPDDGLIDIMAMCKVHYVKAHAYRIKPLETKGYLSIDGEPFPFEEYQVEVHQGLGTFMSPYGHYAANFEPTPRKQKER
ncbi:hypothetical protein CPC08DRAFT_734307 [Agrocybe pediades]|nr:hypothetical protein CPC08DRAFT_734307 [Agrocybe pediades]